MKYLHCALAASIASLSLACGSPSAPGLIAEAGGGSSESSGGFGGRANPGSGGSSASKSLGVAGSSASAAGGSTSSAVPTCAATMAAGAMPLVDAYLSTSVIGKGGYTYAVADGMGSTGCVDSGVLCGKGSTASNTASPSTIWGVNVGLNLNQVQAAGATAEAYAVPASATGVVYALSNLPTQGARVVVDNGGVDYCAPLLTAAGTLLWATFNTACWDDSGTSLKGAPQSATHVQIQVVAGPLAAPFDFCVTSLGFAGVTSGGGTGTGGAGGGTGTSGTCSGTPQVCSYHVTSTDCMSSG